MMKRPGIRGAAILVFILSATTAFSQSIQRESIGTLGSSMHQPSMYYYECAGQPYHTATATYESAVKPGFVQPVAQVLSRSNGLLHVKTYPNPTSGILHVTWNDATIPTTIRLITIQGIVTEMLTAFNGSSTSIDLKDLPAGMYIIEVQQETQFNRIAIIKN